MCDLDMLGGMCVPRAYYRIQVRRKRVSIPHVQEVAARVPLTRFPWMEVMPCLEQPSTTLSIERLG